MSQTHIGLLDCNNFFVSCERLFRPDLWGKPVVVLSSNDGCIIARSQEVKDIGIPMGVPYFEVKDTLKNYKTAIFSSNFTLYRDISRRVFDIVRDEVDLMEQYSIDEAFFIVRGSTIEVASARLRERIGQLVGIPVSIGLAASKTQAKYANHVAKQGSGVSFISPQTFAHRASSIALGEVWGVGVGRVRHYAKHGMHTVTDLVAADPARVEDLFGVEGVRLQHELSGHSVLPVRAQRARAQSVMSSRSFSSPTDNRAVLQDALAYHVAHALEDIRAQGQVTGEIRVMIRPSRYGQFALRGGSMVRVLESPTADTLSVQTIASELLSHLYQPGVLYTKAGVICTALRPRQYTQESLFSSVERRADRSELLCAVDGLNQRFGAGTVLIGSRLQSTAWQPKRDWLSPSYTTRWSDIALVRAA